MNRKLTTQEKKYLIYGKIKNLSEPVPWTQGLSSLFEHITWTTSTILGVSKSAFRDKAVQLSVEQTLRELTKGPIEKDKLLQSLFDSNAQTIDSQSSIQLEMQLLNKVKKYVKTAFQKEINQNINWNREDGKARGLINANEALRQNRFYSEDYLNKEFDIFFSLVSNVYLDLLYSKYFSFAQGNEWFTQGNSALFGNSINEDSVQMDNIAYNPTSKLLVGNELKLGGKKNPDQILKYCFLYLKLKEKGFINLNDNFGLLFFSEKSDLSGIKDVIELEFQYCRTTEKNHKWFLPNEKKIRAVTEQMKIALITWKELLGFNEKFYSTLEGRDETLKKLIFGFNNTLKQKTVISNTLD